MLNQQTPQHQNQEKEEKEIFILNKLNLETDKEKLEMPFSINQNIISSSRKKKNERFSMKKLKSFMNATGPADYDLPNLWLSFHMASSRMHTSPCFSMRKRCKTPLLNKDQIQDLKGIGMPGVGTYEIPSKITSGPKYTISNAMRFTGTIKFTSLTHTFHVPENYSKSSYIFGKDSRFKYEKDEELLRSKAPGPGAYNKKSSFNVSHSTRFGFGSAEKISNIVYHKELQNSYLSKHSPGPGTYIKYMI